jgi:hypothetical protein
MLANITSSGLSINTTNLTRWKVADQCHFIARENDIFLIGPSNVNNGI